MRLAADSSILVRLYLDKEGADAIEQYLADDAKVISVSALARVEVLNVLLRDPDLGAAARFEEDLDEGVRLRTESVDWPDAFQQAESLARRFAPTLRPGGHDLVLVAAAVVMGRSTATPASVRWLRRLGCVFGHRWTKTRRAWSGTPLDQRAVEATAATAPYADHT
jgi:uncharacterized protein with PIN domain